MSKKAEFIATLLLICTAVVLLQVVALEVKSHKNTSSTLKSNHYLVHYLPDGVLNEFYMEDEPTLQSDGITFTLPGQSKNNTVHISTSYEYVQNPTPEVVRGLRLDRKIGFSNLPSNFMESTDKHEQ